MIKVFSIAYLVLSSTILYGQKSNPFTSFQYDSIVIFDFESRGESKEELSIINGKNKLASNIKRRKTLTRDESKKITRRLGLKSSYGQVVAACFDPHLGIVYFLNGEPIRHITVCIDCNRLISSIDIPNQRQGKQSSDEGDVYYTLIGMSKKIRIYLNKLLQEHSFSHTIDGESIFDN